MWQRSRSRAVIGALVLMTATAAHAKPPHKGARGAAPAPALVGSADGAAPRFMESDSDPNASMQTDPQILNHDEMLSLVRKYAAEIVEAVATGQVERDKAVRAKDAIKLTCIQDRLANLKIMK